MSNFDKFTSESIMSYSIPKAWLEDAADYGLKLTPAAVDIKLLKDFYKVDEPVEPEPIIRPEGIDHSKVIPESIQRLRPVITSYLNDDGQSFEDIFERYEKDEDIIDVPNWHVKLEQLLREIKPSATEVIINHDIRV